MEPSANKSAAGQPAPPWYRQFWPWFLMLFPLAAIVAGVATLIVAQQGSDVPISGAVERRGLLRLEDPDALERARERGLSAQLECVDDCARLRLRLSGEVSEAEPVLDFHHVLDPARDQSVALRYREPGLFVAVPDPPLSGRYRLLLRSAPEPEQWMLRGGFDSVAGRANLSPDG